MCLMKVVGCLGMVFLIWKVKVLRIQRVVSKETTLVWCGENDMPMALGWDGVPLGENITMVFTISTTKMSGYTSLGT